MKIKIFIVILLCFFSAVCSADQRSHPDSWKNFLMSSSTSDTPSDLARYCKQMGYEYFNFKSTGVNWSYTGEEFKGLKYYLFNFDGYFRPPNASWWTSGIIPYDGSGYDASQQQWFLDNMVWRSATHTSYVDKLAYGSSFNVTGAKPRYCYQNPSVRQLLIDSMVYNINTRLSHQQPAGFAGWGYDEPKIIGWFGTWSGSEALFKTIEDLTGGTSSCVATTHNHDYNNVTDATVEMWTSIRAKLKREYGNHIRMIAEPTRFYRVNNPEWSEYMYRASLHDRKSELVMDYYLQEATGLNFLQDSNIYSSGMCDSFTKTGSVGRFWDHNDNKLVAAACGTSGAWFNWTINWNGESGENASVITDVYPRLKLVRCVANWTHLTNTGTQNTSWDGNIFTATNIAYSGDAPHAWIGTYTIYATHWKRPDEKFVVKMGTNTDLYEPVVIGTGLYVKEIYSTNAFFEPVTDVKSTQWTQTGNSWQINSGIVTGTLTDGGVGYIFTVLPIGGYSGI